MVTTSVVVAIAGRRHPPPGEASDTGGAGSTTGTATAMGPPAVKEAEKVPVLSVPWRISLLLDFGLG